MRPLAVAGSFFVVAAALVAAAGCQSDAVAVDVCRRVEYVRCDRAEECGIDLARLGSANNAEGCRRYYRDACLHGLESRVDPPPVEVDRCEAALREGPCSGIQAPASVLECSFLIPPPPAPADAAADAVADGNGG